MIAIKCCLTQSAYHLLASSFELVAMRFVFEPRFGRHFYVDNKNPTEGHFSAFSLYSILDLSTATFYCSNVRHKANHIHAKLHKSVNITNNPFKSIYKINFAKVLLFAIIIIRAIYQK